MIKEKSKDGHNVFNFFTVIEADAADDFIRNMHAEEGFFKGIGLSVGTIEDSEIRIILVVFF